MRTFVAVELPDTLRAALAGATAPWLTGIRGARATSPAAMHLTLRFLGEIEPVRVAPIVEALAAVGRGCTPWDTVVRGLGAFPSALRARIVWAGVDDPHGRLTRLVSRLDAALTPLGFPPEDRAYAPHVTLARLKASVQGAARSRGPHRRPATGLAAALGTGDAASATPFGALPVRELVLFESVLDPRGARHTPLARLPLCGRTQGDDPSRSDPSPDGSPPA